MDRRVCLPSPAPPVSLLPSWSDDHFGHAKFFYFPLPPNFFCPLSPPSPYSPSSPPPPSAPHFPLPIALSSPSRATCSVPSQWIFFSKDEDVKELAITLGIQQSGSSTSAAMFLTSWMLPPLYTSLSVSLVLHWESRRGIKSLTSVFLVIVHSRYLSHLSCIFPFNK